MAAGAMERMTFRKEMGKNVCFHSERKEEEMRTFLNSMSEINLNDNTLTSFVFFRGLSFLSLNGDSFSSFSSSLDNKLYK